MAYFTLTIPPGMNRGETEAKSKGAYYSGTLVRSSPGGDLVAEKGWIPRSADPVTGVARAMLVWKDNNDVTRIGVGTEQGLFAYSLAGVLTDITPSGFAIGQVDTAVVTGYGGAEYGTGDYGAPRGLDEVPSDASFWTFGVWDQYLVGCCSTDGSLYQWDNDTGNDAEVIPNAPTLCRGLFVVENFLMALGADGNPRKLAWSDRGFNQIWTPDATNQAGDFLLPTSGKLMCGASVGGLALVLTDVDAWVSSYALPAVWDFRRLGDGIGAISQGCLVNASTRAFWWSLGGFRVFEGGFVNDLPCPIWDYLDQNLNVGQKAKVSGWLNSVENEVVWVYPSINSTECDRKVTFNYVTGKWWDTEYNRTCGFDRIENGYPLAMSPDGVLYDHERGYSYDDGQVAKARTGPIKIGEGDYVARIRAWLPDQRTYGDATLTVYAKNRQMDAYIPYGPYTAASVVDLRITGRIIEVEYTLNGDAAIGEPQMDMMQGGRR